MAITDKFRKPGRYFLVTFGCQMNISDSEKIAHLLEERGYQPTLELESADLVIVNMCSVRKSAVDRIYGLAEKIEHLKKSGHKIEAVLTGCYLKSAEQRKLLKIFDLVCARPDFFENPEYLSQPAHYHSFFRAYVPIMTGCNNFCAYCIVPFTRGREYSRPAKEVLDEVKKLAQGGYREIWLLGQNVNSYQGKDGHRTVLFPELLSRANAIDGDFWLYFTTPHPKDLSDQLIQVMAQSSKVAPYLNLPAQSGDDIILKKMNRPYVIKDYKNIVNKLRQAFQENRKNEEKRLALSTDIIVGFPGETEAMFQETVKLMTEVEYDMAYIARYSPRPLTSAWPLGDPIPEAEKIKREKILNEILKKTALTNNRFYLNKTIPVLIDYYDAKKKALFGKSRAYKTVKIDGGQDNLIGQVASVKITEAGSWGLYGKIK